MELYLHFPTCLKHEGHPRHSDAIFASKLLSSSQIANYHAVPVCSSRLQHCSERSLHDLTPRSITFIQIIHNNLQRVTDSLQDNPPVGVLCVATATSCGLGIGLTTLVTLQYRGYPDGSPSFGAPYTGGRGRPRENR